jgi:hypothetical protein
MPTTVNVFRNICAVRVELTIFRIFWIEEPSIGSRGSRIYFLDPIGSWDWEVEVAGKVLPW